jgi:hypothetical protein
VLRVDRDGLLVDWGGRLGTAHHGPRPDATTTSAPRDSGLVQQRGEMVTKETVMCWTNAAPP